MTNAYGTPLLRADIYADDSKAVRITPAGGITRFAQFHAVKAVNAVNQFDFDIMLEDKIAASLTKGYYVELFEGRTTGTLWYSPQSGASTQTLWASGYIETIDKETQDASSTYTIALQGAMVFLSSQVNGDDLYADPGLGYFNILHFLNGINPAGSGAGTNQKGILTGTQWTAAWVDSLNNVVVTTTTTGTNSINATNIAVATSAGITANVNAATNNAISINGIFYQLDGSPPDGTHVGIKGPGLVTSVPAGSAVHLYNYALPGAGDKWYTANDTVMNSLSKLAKRYNFYYRERPGSTRTNGVVEIGPLYDSSGLQIWGGTQLANQLGQDSTTYSFEPNAQTAQSRSLAVIDAVSFSDDFSHIINTCYPYGHGGGRNTVTIRPLMGGDPPGNGWTSYQPYGAGGRQYYLKPGSKITWQGNTFEYIAFQRDDAGYQYGVINRGNNLGANVKPPYGVHEISLKDRQTYGADELLSEGLGLVEYNADPVPTYLFGVRFPLTSATGVPTAVQPGQTIDIRYTGEVHDAIDLDTNGSRTTYGQFVGQGSYRYLKYPTNADPTDENGAVDVNKVKKLQRVAEVEEWWDESGYRAQYTMGKAEWKSKHWEEALARDMENHRHVNEVSHDFIKRPIHHIPFYFSRSPLAWEDKSDSSLHLAAGALVVSDVPDETFFGDHHSVSFTVGISDSDQIFDFWFAKAASDASLTLVSSSRPYGILRLAMTSSGASCGFYTTTNGTSFAAQGVTHSNPFMGTGKRVTPRTFRLHVSWSSQKYHASIVGSDAQGLFQEYPLATWNDTTPAIGIMGAIGWHLIGGASSCRVSNIQATAQQHKSAPKHGVTGTGLRSTLAPKKRNRLTAAQFNSGVGGLGDGTGRLAKAI